MAGRDSDSSSDSGSDSDSDSERLTPFPATTTRKRFASLVCVDSLQEQTLGAMYALKRLRIS